MNVSARTTRREENKNLSEYVIKSTLGSLLASKDNNFREAIRSNIEKRVKETSKGVLRLSLALTLMIRDIIATKQDPLDVELPNFLTSKNDTFGIQLMVGIKRALKPIKEIEEFLSRRDSILPDVPDRLLGDSNTLTYAVAQYMTNYRTYLETTFEKKQKAYIDLWSFNNNYTRIGESGTIRCLINGWKHITNYVADLKLSAFIDNQRELLKLNSKNFVSSLWIKKNYESIIVYYSIISTYMISMGHKGVLIAPLCNTKRYFIQIDNRIFEAMLKELTSKKAEDFESNKDFYWNTVFNTSQHLTTKQRGSCNFTYCIQTDGVAACIHYRRPKLEITRDPYEPFNKDSTDRVIGQDPGRTTLFSGAELINKTWKKHKLSKRQYYHDSGIFKAGKDSIKWALPIQSILDQMSRTDTKSDINSVIEYITIVKTNFNKLWQCLFAKKWAKNKLKLYSGKKRTYDKFFNSLKDKSGRRVVVAYGDAGFAPNARKELSAPTTSLLKETKKHFDVVMIDEFRTTQIQYRTGVRLSKVNTSPRKSVRGLLWCRSTIGSGFIDRDFNASKNMILCYNMHPHRPPKMDRSDEALPEPCAKYIKSRQRERGDYL